MIFRKSLILTAAVGIAILALGLAGCSASKQASSSNGGIVQMYIGGSGQLTENYNPFSPTVLKVVKGGVYEPLFYFNPLASLGTKPTKLLGETYRFNSDGTVVTVTTRSGLKWSDGKAFGPEDVAYTFNTIRTHPEINTSGNAPAGKVTGKNEVTLTFDHPSFTDGPTILSTDIVPEHIWATKKNVVTDINKNPVGTGPLKFGAFTAQSYLLKKNPEFRDAKNFAPSGVRLYSLSGNQAATNKFLAGDLDLAGIAVPNVKKVLKPYPYLHTSPNPSNFNVLNTCSNANLGCAGPQTDPAVRHAIAAALDRNQINKLSNFGLSTAVSPTFVDAKTNGKYITSKFSDSSYLMTPDIQTADSILEKDGWTKGSDGIYMKNGQRLSMQVVVSTGYTNYISTLKVMTQQLKAAGIEIVTSSVANAENVSKRALGNFQLGIDGMFPGPINDPYYYYNKYFNSAAVTPVGKSGDPYGNTAKFSDPKVNAAIAKAAATTDPAVKAAAYAEVQEAIVPALPYIPILTDHSYVLNNTTHWSGFPTDTNPYSDGGDVGIGIVLEHLKAK